eukprot:1822331-Alexandrium_andersonii.AAC.1
MGHGRQPPGVHEPGHVGSLDGAVRFVAQPIDSPGKLEQPGNNYGVRGLPHRSGGGGRQSALG